MKRPKPEITIERIEAMMITVATLIDRGYRAEALLARLEAEHDARTRGSALARVREKLGSHHATL